VIEKKVARQMQGGDVILLHDGGYRAMGADRAQTVIVTENLIRRYKDQGYDFVTVEKMLAVNRQLSAVS
jgi:peptidoglycan/xylan/chitin deacetylase (PgdA/CDA1 family)